MKLQAKFGDRPDCAIASASSLRRNGAGQRQTWHNERAALARNIPQMSAGKAAFMCFAAAEPARACSRRIGPFIFLPLLPLFIDQQPDVRALNPCRCADAFYFSAKRPFCRIQAVLGRFTRRLQFRDNAALSDRHRQQTCVAARKHARRRPISVRPTNSSCAPAGRCQLPTPTPTTLNLRQPNAAPGSPDPASASGAGRLQRPPEEIP